MREARWPRVRSLAETACHVRAKPRAVCGMGGGYVGAQMGQGLDRGVPFRETRTWLVEGDRGGDGAWSVDGARVEVKPRARSPAGFLSAAGMANSGAARASTGLESSLQVRSLQCGTSSLHPPIHPSPHTTPRRAMPPPSTGTSIDPSSGATISAPPQINGFAMMSSSSTKGTPSQPGAVQGTMAEQQKRAHLYVGNLSPRVNEQSECARVTGGGGWGR